MKRLSLVLSLFYPVVAAAQYERFELGRRLVELEKTWDGHRSTESKKRALPHLSNAVNRFFSFQFGTAAQSLDSAKFLLRSKELPPEAVRWCLSIGVNPATRLIDSSEKEIELELRPFYSVKAAVPKEVKLRLTTDGTNFVEINRFEFPIQFRFPLPPVTKPSEDIQLNWAFCLDDGQPFDGGSLTISRVEKARLRLDLLRDKLTVAPVTPRGMEAESLQFLIDLLQQLADGNTLETNYPATRLFDEAESLADAVTRDDSFYRLSSDGQHWVSLPVGRSDAVFRMFVPKGLDRKKPVPIVFALHGAGGSENLFFDGYGNGITRKMCEKRGWMMVAPRSPGFIGSPAIGAILDELTKRYPIDPNRVFLIGHSMGAAQAISIAQQIPERLAGVVALGGGGQIRKGSKIQNLPFFVGVGKEDFALGAAKSLTANLEKEGVAKLKFHEYPDVEHMMIVREAIPDVFELFDEWGK